jgi:hypothetical protein
MAFKTFPAGKGYRPGGPDRRGSEQGRVDVPAARDRTLTPDDEILFPLSKNAFAQYDETAGAQRILRLFHADKEIAFSDPAYFAFGEALVGQTRFRAGDAVAWGPLGWPGVRRALEQLIGAGILRYADREDPPSSPLRHEERNSPLKPAACERAMTWDQSEAILGALSGRAIETGHIELVVPVYRVAHMYLDSQDRQLGEANVFPPAMRLDRPTLWRTCTYSGSRYQPDRPMNVTALRAMRSHWRQVMAIVRRVTDSYRARFPAVGERGWTIGDIERLSVCAMALPSYLLMRRRRRVENGRLHPALSSVFRLTDGPRTALHNMVFAGFGEPARSGDTLMTGAELHAYAERNHSFRTPRGVCAGPPAMIDDFLAVLLDGRDPKGGWPDRLDPEISEALGEVEPAIDYGLTGLQVYSAVYSLFPAAAEAQSELRRIALDWRGAGSTGLTALLAGLGISDGPGAEQRRRHRLDAYDDMYRQCGAGLAGRGRGGSLRQRREAQPPLPAETMAALRAAFQRRLADLPDSAAPAASLAQCLGRFVGLVQATLDAALEAQGRINALLGREPPKRPFTGRDLATGPFIGRNLAQYRLGDEATGPKTAPFLVDDIARLLGVAIEIGADRVDVFRSPGG